MTPTQINHECKRRHRLHHQQQQDEASNSPTNVTTTSLTTTREESTSHSLLDEPRTPNLPDYEAATKIPNKMYNGVEGTKMKEIVDTLYEIVVRWRKNLFQLPTGQCGKKFIKLMTEWVNKFNSGSSFEGIAMKVVMMLPSLMLQKPSAKSKAKDHSKRLEERLKWWEEGNIDKIKEEAEAI